MRRALSEELQRNPRLPHEIALVLANDIAKVAVPMVENSPVLTDIDLLAVMAKLSLDHQLAVARRRRLSERVSEALVETEKQPVVDTLVANTSAKMSPFTFHRIVPLFSTDEAVLENIVRRSSLPMRVVRELDRLLSGELHDELVRRHPRPKEINRDMVAKMSDEDILEFVDFDGEDGEVNDFIHEINRMGRLSPPLIVQSMCLGDFNFLVYAMSELAQVSTENADVLIFDPGRHGLKSLQKVTDFPPALISVIRLLAKISLKIGYRGNSVDHMRFYRNAMKKLDKKYNGQATRNLGGLLGSLAREHEKSDHSWPEVRSVAST